MKQLLPLIPVLPLLGFLILAFAGRYLSKISIAIIGAGTVCLSALLTLVIGVDFIAGFPSRTYVSQHLWTWFQVTGLSVDLNLYLDALSLVFVFVITFVGALIHVYSVAFMSNDKDYSRFFACMNLFVFSMLLLVMADNLLFLYLGWEGVGLCSYLLIGFWYEDPANGYAARKAFIITRVGDTAMAIGLFIIFYQLGTLAIPAVQERALVQFQPGSTIISAIALLLLAGAVGKSAQLPLQTWLPDAMAGPTPVSALIHAATMVTAGVYLIARMHVIFQLSPFAQATVAIIGATTLLLAGFSALTQSDIKRVLAYSTISQVGYMFLALGLGAWSAAVFHFMTHAFFKALLFLAAGVIIEALHHEHNMFKMGGLKDSLPAVFLTFLIGSASLAALPLVTAGFYSKDAILWFAWTAQNGNPTLWFMATLGACITAAYTTRMLILVFWGETKTEPEEAPGKIMVVPLIILAFFSMFAGFVEMPHNLGSLHLFSEFLSAVVPEAVVKANLPSEFLFQLIALLATAGGVYLAYLYYYKEPERLEKLKQSPSLVELYRFWQAGWRFDQFYDNLFVKPILYFVKINKDDVLDKFYSGISRLMLWFNRILSYTQSGSLRWYVMGVLIGAILILGIQIML